MAAVAGVWLAYAMFALPVVEVSVSAARRPGPVAGRIIATFGLILTIAGGIRFAAAAIPMLVGLYITAAYWFTASTSFANPAVTLARALTASFAGIAPQSAPGFIAAQIFAALASALVLPWLFTAKSLTPRSAPRKIPPNPCKTGIQPSLAPSGLTCIPKTCGECVVFLDSSILGYVPALNERRSRRRRRSVVGALLVIPSENMTFLPVNRHLQKAAAPA